MCTHERTIITHPENEIVCCDCGMVIEQCYDNFNIEHLSLVTDEIDVIVITDLISNAVANLHLPANLIEISKNKYCDNRIDASFKKFKNNELACFTLYDEIVKEKIPIFLQDLCKQFNTNERIIWNVQKASETFSNVDPVSFVSKVCEELDIPYCLQKYIFQTISSLEDISTAKPITICACAIYATTNGLLSNITLEKICEHCRVSKSSVLSLYRKYEST